MCASREHQGSNEGGTRESRGSHREQRKDSKATETTRIKAEEEERVYFVSRRKGECQELNTSQKLQLLDREVQQDPWTLNLEWRVPAGREQKGNNGSWIPYIGPQSFGSWISRSREVNPSRCVSY